MDLDERIAELQERISAQREEIKTLVEIQERQDTVFDPEEYVFLPLMIGGIRAVLPVAKEM